MSCIVNFKNPIEVDLPSQYFDGEICLVEKEHGERRHDRIATIYFEAKHLPVLRELVSKLEEIEAKKAAVVVEITDHVECVQPAEQFSDANVAGEERWDPDAT